jgi:hypothetical protein
MRILILVLCCFAQRAVPLDKRVELFSETLFDIDASFAVFTVDFAQDVVLNEPLSLCFNPYPGSWLRSSFVGTPYEVIAGREQ